ncbi:MAG: outer membrane beta-barrel protein, partial [Proteobacteria bacterium]|nr:outer membrane beta-barrel protein [Pseudomonadota bacterium]
FFVRVQDSFQDTGDPFGSEEEFRVGVQTERWNNRARLSAGYEFAEKYGIEGLYENFRERYDLIKDQFEDKIENIYGGAVLYKVTVKTSLLVQYLREDIEYDSQNDGVDAWSSTNSQDHSTNSFLIGARFEPGGKLTGEFKFGYGTIEFENYADKNGNVYNDDSFWIVQADVGYKPVEKTSLSLIINRSKEASTSADVSGDVSAAYLRTSVGIALTQTFTDRISMNLGFDWSHKDYLDESPGNPDKSFDLYTVKGGLDYLIRDWLKTGLEYKYQDNQVSNTGYKADEYTVNSVAIQLTGMF